MKMTQATARRGGRRPDSTRTSRGTVREREVPRKLPHLHDQCMSAPHHTLTTAALLRNVWPQPSSGWRNDRDVARQRAYWRRPNAPFLLALSGWSI